MVVIRVRLGVALGVLSLLAACGKTDANRGPTAAAGTGGSNVGACETAASGDAGMGGEVQPSRCDIDLVERCGDFELASPRALALRPDEYRNSIATLFGITVDVTALLPGPFTPYPVNDRAALDGLALPGYAEAAALAAEQIANDAASRLACPGGAGRDGCVA